MKRREKSICSQSKQVFNRSSASFGYGSPDVLPMFVNGQDYIFFETYPDY